MRCPPEIAEVLHDILTEGLLAIRGCGSVKVAALHADHLHNLPGLLGNYSPDRLGYYWDVERPPFARRCPPEQLAGWEDLWDRLAPLVAAESASAVVTSA